MLKKIIPFLLTGIILFASACSHRQKGRQNLLLHQQLFYKIIPSPLLHYID